MMLSQGGDLNDLVARKLPLATTAQNGSAVRGPLSVWEPPDPDPAPAADW
jgi:hypothetical protein